MQYKKVFVLCLFFTIFLKNYAQKKRFDSILKIGKVGYRLSCNNKSEKSNTLSIHLLGFSGTGNKDFNFEVKGKLKGAEIDDLNNDGMPDLVMYFVLDSNLSTTVLAIRSDKNENIEPIIFPELRDDLKLAKGYIGFDDFKLVEGSLFRAFPIFNLDSNKKIIHSPEKKYRHIIYRLIKGERFMQFKSIKMYESENL